MNQGKLDVVKQEMARVNITKWTTQIRLFSLQLKIGTALYSQEKQDLELTGSDQELLFPKFRLKLKKVEKTTRPFRYDLNQIPCDYVVEVMNTFKELGLVDRVPEELWTEAHNTVQEAVTKTIAKKKEGKKAKWLSEEALQIAEERREAKSKGERERYTQLNAEFQRTARRNNK